MSPINGRQLHNSIINCRLYISANFPRTTAPNAPSPNARPTINPDTIPTFPGTSSCAYTTITLKLLELIKPIHKNNGTTHTSETCGNNSASGAEPNIENTMIFFLPNRSANGPPKKVPNTPAIINANTKYWAFFIDKP
ncbi:Uncharacterised protein [Streptococcus pneumoniae]|nr:Uncharacterised protein [Streptococcus pneumoniae]